MGQHACGGANATSTLRAPWISLRSTDFPAALSSPALTKSAHFVLHHVAASPASSVQSRPASLVQELSTDPAPNWPLDVDNINPPRRWWLGLVVPKRHARRSVTRSLIKRQMRAQADLHHEHLPPGQWVLRLRAPFDPGRYPSAASMELQIAARAELALVFANAGAA